MNETISAKLQQIAENVPQVYAKGKADGIVEGKQAEYDAFWDAFLPIGVNNQGYFAGGGWNDSTFYPNQDIVFMRGRGDYMFFCNAVSNIKQRLIECGVRLDTSACINFNSTFSFAATTELPEISTINATAFSQIFRSCSKLVTIDKFILKDDGTQPFSNAFNDCSSLENIVIEGVIGQNGLNLQWSTNLSKASIESVISCLSTTTSGLSITLSRTAVDYAFEEVYDRGDGSWTIGWANLVATKPNWTISLV